MDSKFRVILFLVMFALVSGCNEDKADVPVDTIVIESADVVSDK